MNQSKEMMTNINTLQDVARFPEENPYPVMRLEQDGSICYANEASQLLLEHWHIKAGEKVPAIWLARVKQALEAGRLTIQRERIGNTTYSLTLVPLPDRHCLNLYGQDISRLERLLKRLRQTRANLQQTVEKRTAQLKQTVQSLMDEVQERLQTETEVKKNQQRLSEAQRIAHIGSWEWNLSDNSLWWSDQAYAIWGHSPGSFEPSYDRFLASIHPDDRSAVKAAIDKCLQNGGDYKVEHRLLRPDGDERIVLERGQIAAGATERTPCLRGTVQDITTLRRQSETIQDQHTQIERQGDLLDSAHDMITVFDLDSRIHYWNQGAEKTYGWMRDEAKGKISHQLLKTEFNMPLADILSTLQREGRWEGELIQEDRQGRRLWVESRWVLRRHDNRRPEAILAIDRDISLRKQAEMSREEARGFAENVIATIQDALIVLDGTLLVVSANESFYQTFSTSPDDIVDRPIYQLPGGQWNHPDLRKLLEEILPKNAQLKNYELNYIEQDKLDRYLLLNARRMHQGTESRELILLAIQDITQQKKQEKAIAAHEERLHALTEELLQAEDTQREKTALALHDSIGPTLAFAKRELAALEKDVSPQWHDNLRRVGQQISQAIQQTRHLTTELSPPTLRVFGLEAALEELADAFAAKHNLQCTTLYAEETIPLTKNHQTFLYRSVRELLINIVKHARATQVTICIVRDHDETIEITVEDNGHGFTLDNLTHCQSETIKGFGLLSIEERLDYIGGRFTIQSRPGQGTRVVLRAPITNSQKGNRQHG